MGNPSFANISLEGGLDLTSTHFTNQSKIGSCKKLVNFEPSLQGGYRKINGYEKYSEGRPSGSENEIYGLFKYADGVVAVSGTGIYFSSTPTSWITVNNDSYVAQTGTVEVTNTSGSYIDVVGSGTAFLSEFVVGETIRIDGNYREIAAIASNTSLTLVTEISGGVSAGASIYKNGITYSVFGEGVFGSISYYSPLDVSIYTARTNQGKSEIAWLENDGEYGSLVITDSTGNNDAAWFKITGVGGSRQYLYDTLTTAGFAAPSLPKHCCTFEDRVVLGGYQNGKNSIAWSDRLQNQRFDGASAGTVSVDSDIVAIYPFKDRLIIFCRNSIYQLVNINSVASIAVLQISYNSGCVSSFTIQELGSDLLYLSQDGIRALSATDQYGDVQIGVISRNVDVYVKELLSNITDYNLSSTVVRHKNQYRLFYTNSSFADGKQLGLVGTLRQTMQGGLMWNWSRIQGMPVSALHSSTILSVDTPEEIYQGGFDGYVYFQDKGNTFNGSNINASLELNEIDYGDSGTKKTLHYIKIYGEVEGKTDPVDIQVKYDFNDQSTIQPAKYNLNGFAAISTYGDAIYGTDVYSGQKRFNSKVLVEGSGYSNTFSIDSSGKNFPYSLNSIYVDYRIGNRQ